MKKILSILIGLVLILALVSCAADISSDDLQEKFNNSSVKKL